MASRQLVIDASALSFGHVGLGVYTSRLIKLLAPSLAENLVIVIDESSVPLLPIPNLQVRTYPSASRLPGPLQGYERKHRACSLARREYPDALFLSPNPMWALRPPAHTAVVMHDLIYRHFPWYEGHYGLRRVLNRLCESFAQNCEATITVSEFSRQEIIRELNMPAHRVTCIPNWIEDDFVLSAASTDLSAIRQHYGLPEKFWLYLGGYDYRKNVEFLLEAYARASRDTACPPPLVLAGAIPRRQDRTLCDVQGALQRLDKNLEVIMPGVIAPADLAGVYKAADLFIFPSRFEGFGYPPLEANACGTPALVADNSSLGEIVPLTENRFDDSRVEDLSLILRDVALGVRHVPLFSWDQYSEQQALAHWQAFLKN